MHRSIPFNCPNCGSSASPEREDLCGALAGHSIYRCASCQRMVDPSTPVIDVAPFVPPYHELWWVN